MPHSPLSPVVKASLWMVVSLASFMAMAVSVRELSASFDTFEILFFRSVVGLCVLLPFVLRNDGQGLKTARPVFQGARNAVHFVAQYCWVVGVSLLPLAQVFALEFTMPVWAVILAVLILGERMSVPRMVAVAGGFIGVLIVVKPGLAVFNPLSLIVLVSAAGFACSVIMVKILIRHDSPLTIIFYMAAMQLPMGLVPALFNWVTPGWAHLPWFVILGITALSAHYGLASALKLVDAITVLPVDFLRLPLIALVGAMVYAEPLDPWVFAGAAIIFGANYYSVWRENRR